MVQSRLGAQHHPPEVSGLIALARSKKRREQHRTSIIAHGSDAPRAEVVIPLDAFDAGTGLQLEYFRRWFVRGVYRSGTLKRAPSSAAIVLDDFSFVLYLDRDDRQYEISGTHDGSRFVEAARRGDVDVYLTAGVDVRRAAPEGFAEAARDGRIAGASVAAFVVDTIDVSID